MSTQIVAESPAAIDIQSTAIGAIPHGWRVAPLGEIARLERGKFSARPRNDPKYFGGGIPFIQTGDVRNAQGRITTYSQDLNDAGLKVSKLFPAGTMFITIAANIGDLGIASFATACPDSLVAIAPQARTDKHWLYYALSAHKQSLESIATQNAQLNLNLEKLRPYLLAVPPLAEQKAIAEALASTDEVVWSLERLIAKKQAIKQGIIQQLLTGRTRLPGFAAQWSGVEVGELLDFKNGLNKGGEYFGSGTPIVNFMDVINGPIIRADDVAGRVTLTRDEIKRFSANRGDLFFTRTSETINEVGTAAVLVDDIQDASFSGFLLRGRPRTPDLDSRFLAHLFSLDVVRSQVISSATYTTRALTNGRSLSRVSVHIPGVEEQRVVANMIADVDAELAVLRARLTKARSMKSGMMQQLLTGRTRLPVRETVS